MRQTNIFLLLAWMFASCNKDNSTLLPAPGAPGGISAKGALYRLDTNDSADFSIATGKGSPYMTDCSYGNWLVQPSEPPYGPVEYYSMVSSSILNPGDSDSGSFSVRFLMRPNLLGRSYLSRAELVDFFQVDRVVPIGQELDMAEIRCGHPLLDGMAGADTPGSGALTVRAVDDLDWKNQLEGLKAVRVTFDMHCRFDYVPAEFRDGQATLFFTYKE